MVLLAFVAGLWYSTVTVGTSLKGAVLLKESLEEQLVGG